MNHESVRKGYDIIFFCYILSRETHGWTCRFEKKKKIKGRVTVVNNNSWREFVWVCQVIVVVCWFCCETINKEPGTWAPGLWRWGSNGPTISCVSTECLERLRRVKRNPTPTWRPCRAWRRGDARADAGEVQFFWTYPAATTYRLHHGPLGSQSDL